MGAAGLILGFSPLVGAAWLLAKHGFRVEPGLPRILAAAVLAWGWMTVGMEILGNLGRLNPAALVAWSVGGLVVAGMVAGFRPAVSPVHRATTSAPESIGLTATLAKALAVWACLRLGLISFWQPVKVVSDGPIYHLYMAARWWKAGRLFLVPTPFGEQAAPYFWANGELWYAWLLTLGRGDAVAKLGQAPFLVLGGMAVEAIARHLDIRATAARLAAVWFVTITPELVFAFEPNVDSILLAGYLMGVYFWLRAFTGPDERRGAWLILGSLAAGLGMGTKPTGIVFFPPLLALVVVGLGWRRPGWRRFGIDGATAVVPALAMMGYWPIRNALLTGNPLYPMHLAVGGKVWLAGWFGPDAMRRSFFYVPREDWRAGIDIILTVIDPRELPCWLAGSVGFRAIRSRRPETRSVTDRWIWGFAALGLFNLAAYWLVIPYRTQQRFAFPALAVLAIPLARLFDRAGWLRVTGVVLLAAHLLTPQPWPFGATEAQIPWDLNAAIPNAVPAALDWPLTVRDLAGELVRPRYWATVILGVGVLGAAVCGAIARRASRRGLVWTWRVVALAWITPALVMASLATGAGQGIAFPYFPEYLVGWAELEARTSRQGARIAYAGHKIPYYLMGSKLQNDVQYVNIDAHRDWLPHNYHRNAPNVGEPSTWPNPFPAWGRLQPDYDAWLANLRAERIDLLVVTRVNIEEGVENVADAARFPIERVWAEAHPESFRPIYGVAQNDPQFRIFQVLPAT